jgi:hypothetical protein
LHGERPLKIPGFKGRGNLKSIHNRGKSGTVVARRPSRGTPAMLNFDHPSELAEGRFWQNGKATPAMFRIVAAALVLLLSASLPASADAKRVALVIGMSDYHA